MKKILLVLFILLFLSCYKEPEFTVLEVYKEEEKYQVYMHFYYPSLFSSHDFWIKELTTKEEVLQYITVYQIENKEQIIKELEVLE